MARSQVRLSSSQFRYLGSAHSSNDRGYLESETRRPRCTAGVLSGRFSTKRTFRGRLLPAAGGAGAACLPALIAGSGRMRIALSALPLAFSASVSFSSEPATGPWGAPCSLVGCVGARNLVGGPFRSEWPRSSKLPVERPTRFKPRLSLRGVGRS